MNSISSESEGEDNFEILNKTQKKIRELLGLDKTIDKLIVEIKFK